VSGKKLPPTTSVNKNFKHKRFQNLQLSVSYITELWNAICLWWWCHQWWFLECSLWVLMLL